MEIRREENVSLRQSSSKDSTVFFFTEATSSRAGSSNRSFCVTNFTLQTGSKVIVSLASVNTALENGWQKLVEQLSRRMHEGDIFLITPVLEIRMSISIDYLYALGTGSEWKATPVVTPATNSSKYSCRAIVEHAFAVRWTSPVLISPTIFCSRLTDSRGFSLIARRRSRRVITGSSVKAKRRRDYAKSNSLEKSVQFPFCSCNNNNNNNSSFNFNGNPIASPGRGELLVHSMNYYTRWEC